MNSQTGSDTQTESDIHAQILQRGSGSDAEVDQSLQFHAHIDVDWPVDNDEGGHGNIHNCDTEGDHGPTSAHDVIDDSLEISLQTNPSFPSSHIGIRGTSLTTMTVPSFDDDNADCVSVFALLDTCTLQTLLEAIVPNIVGLGIFTILDHSQLMDVVTARKITSPRRHSQELPLALLAIVIELELGCLPPALTNAKQILVDSLRIEFLKRVPTLAWKSTDLGFTQCVALLLASHIWSLKEDLVQIAHRWNNLAKLIWSEIRTSETARDAPELAISIGTAIEFQATRVLDLLHYSRISWSVPAEAYIPAARRVESHMPPNTATGSNQTVQSCRHGFFPMFLPLTNILRRVLTSRDPDAMDCIRDSLELFYLEFPPDLLNFSCVKFVYQLEVMIWFHGIFIITFVRQDLLSILTDETLSSHKSFYSALEHALLLGDVIKKPSESY
ncbi:hypothetical protein FPCIR_3187 [Fusarium pseudocircinatum]|uniref:Uncharacterized protein n=1 Tax=Fusarium pseudocircinatum TaxID=56676 RepID=A0A8H5PKW5_9HYPO|nr:hypothetical protein FPCIR_3187 [Fusarium pseudocircinatum]